MIHNVWCSFRVFSSEVSDVASSVFEALSVILEKGQKLKVQQLEDKKRSSCKLRRAFLGGGNSK